MTSGRNSGYDCVMSVRLVYFLSVLFVCGCARAPRGPESGFVPVTVDAGKYQIATLQKITDPTPDAPIHIYIEGDGRSFQPNGRPSSDPTPRGKFVRDLVARDTSANVVYVARPCQFIMSDACTRHDWTDGRFSSDIIDAMTTTIKSVAGTHPIVLVGYSGGAMVSGLVITRNPDINVTRWVTIAGVLNHNAWTSYFGDAPLMRSVDMDKLPDVPQTHYVGTRDRVVPMQLTAKIARATDIIVVQGATHSDFKNLEIRY